MAYLYLSNQVIRVAANALCLVLALISLVLESLNQLLIFLFKKTVAMTELLRLRSLETKLLSRLTDFIPQRAERGGGGGTGTEAGER